MSDSAAAAGRQPAPITDGDVLVVVCGLIAGLALGWVVGVAAASVGAIVTRRRGAVVLAALVAVTLGSLAWRRAWTEANVVTTGPYRGAVTVVADPAPYGRGVRVTLEIAGQRFDAWVFGTRGRRVGELSVGQVAWIDGTRRALRGATADRARLRHVVGIVDVRTWGDVSSGSPASVSAARIRALVRRVADRSMGPDDGALFSGLVLGDDARESPEMVAAFRASGLSHLTAVSGQNITLLMALLGPLLRRLRPAARLGATLAAIAWLGLVTRFEPSVLRAGAMAALGAVAFAAGRPTPPLRLLAISVGLILLVDPLLVRSVGLWLSVGATAGVIVLAPLLSPLLAGPPWIRLPLAMTLGAQAGVCVPSLVVFGRLPVVSIVTNLVAVPVAAVVMTAGVPCAVAAAAVPGLAGVLMSVPTMGTRWVRRVAEVGAAVEPSPAAGLVGWCVLVGLLVVMGCRRDRWCAPAGTDVSP